MKQSILWAKTPEIEFCDADLGLGVHEFYIVKSSFYFAIVENLISAVKEERLVKSNQVRTTIETKISDCRPTIAQTVLYCCTDLIWLCLMCLLKQISENFGAVMYFWLLNLTSNNWPLYEQQSHIFGLPAPKLRKTLPYCWY
jgi:hypothetical protein